MANVKGVARLSRIMYPKGVTQTSGGFTIASFEVVNIEEGNIEVNEKYGTFSMKGKNMPPLKVGEEYYFIAEEGERHPTFGISYEVAFMRTNIQLDTHDEGSVRNFLEIILTKRQVDALYDAIDNPIQVIEDKDAEALCKANGIGMKTAQRIIEHYESQKDYSHAYMELGKYDIPPNTIRKITDFYGSPELAVEKIKENPYKLMDIDGFAFKKCDKIFFSLGGRPNEEIRVKSFLIYHLEQEANNGHTWTTPIALIESAVEYIPDADKSVIGRILISNPDIFYLTEDKKRISLAIFPKLEALVTREIHRIIETGSERKFDTDNWEEDVARVEEEQGWEFTSQQKEAMKMMLDNNISILQGYGGTGKTTTLKAVADVLEARGYIYAQTALSGKASSNLTLVTKKEGSTIHRLLGYQPMDGGFNYKKGNPLPYDIIIIDEISMVDAKLFGYLLLAVRDGAKVIMIGDSEQLESIGIPVMKPMLESGMIPTMTLTEIHRQAQKSAVVTDSIKIRQGEQVIGRESGRVVHGELEDLEYILTENDDEIFVNALREFYKYVQAEDIMDIQILTQQRTKGKASCLKINNACQKVYNPPSIDKDEAQIGDAEKEGSYILREGDKVINVKNNYDSIDEFGHLCPVFNGNVGIIKKFDTDEEGDKYMLIDFEGIGNVMIYEGNYRSIELAYCITVHKSQGSSSKIVIFAFPFHFTLNTRQLFYTAITRTRVHCVVIATKKTIASAISKDGASNKRTYLKEYLIESLQNKSIA